MTNIEELLRERGLIQDDNYPGTGLTPPTLNPDESQQNLMRGFQLMNALHYPRIARENEIPVLADLPSPTRRALYRSGITEALEPDDYGVSDYPVRTPISPPFASLSLSPAQMERVQASQFPLPPKYGGYPVSDYGNQILLGIGLSALEHVGRTMDVPAGTIRDVADITMQRLKEINARGTAGWGSGEIGSGESLSQAVFGHMGEDITEAGKRIWDRVRTLGHGEDVRFESYIDVLNRYIYGTSDILGTGIEQAPFERGGIVVGGLAADIILDPLWLVGRAFSLGSRAEKALRINKVFDEIGLIKPEYRNMARLAEAQLETGKTYIKEGSPLWRIGEQIEKTAGTLEMGTLTQQFQTGKRGLLSRLQIRNYETTPIETMWSKLSRRLTGGNLVITTEYIPVGGKQIAPAINMLERVGVSDPWTFMDMLFPSQMTKQLARSGYNVPVEGLYEIRQAAGKFSVTRARSEAGNIRKLILESQEIAGQEVRTAMAAGREQAELIERRLDEIVEAKIDLLDDGTLQKSDLRKIKTELRRNLEHTINDYTEAVSVRGDQIEHFLRSRGVEVPEPISTASEGAIYRRPDGGQWEYDDLLRFGVYQEGAAFPVQWTKTRDPATGKYKRVIAPYNDWQLEVLELHAMEFDPLNLPMKHEFEHSNVRFMIEDLRKANRGIYDAEQAAGLRVAELKGNDPFDVIKKFATGKDDFMPELYDDLATSYVWHRVSPETWEWMRTQKEPWIRKAAHTATGWSTTKRFSDTWSAVLKTRKDRRTIEAFNDYMKRMYGVENFFEPNPALREPARMVEGSRRIAAIDYYSRMADNLAAHPGYFMPKPGVPPKGWSRLSDMMSKRAWDAIAWDSKAADKISSVILPDTALPLVMRQAELLQRPDYLKPYMRYLQLTTNWWKTNTLGIWPGYHLGNLISNLQLLWLGGMHDPLMIPLAGKIAAGNKGVVKSIATGVEYTYDDIRTMILASGVDVGFVRGNIEQAVVGASKTPQGRGVAQLLEGYYTSGKPVDIIGGTMTALTGIDPRGLDSTNWAQKLLPGGEEWVANRVGFMVGGAIEGNARTAMFLHLILNEGWSPGDASRRVKEVLFDYTKRSGVKQIASTLIPFYEFTMQNTIFQALNFTQYPARHTTSYRTLLQTLPAIQGQIKDEELPVWLRGRALFKLNSDTAIDITRFAPAYETPSVIANVFGEGFASFNPLIETGMGLAFNLNMFTKRPIKDYPGEKTYFKLGELRVEMPETWRYTFGNLSRAFAETERGDLLRTMTGIKLTELSEARTLQFDTWDTERAIEEFEKGLDPGKSVEEIDRVQRELIHLSALNLAQLTKRYELGVDMDGSPLIPYSRSPGVTDQFDVLRKAEGRILDILKYVRESETLSRSDKEVLTKEWWAAWTENVQKRIDHVLALAHTEPDNAGAGRPADPRQQERITYYNERALDVVESAASTPGIGPYTYITLKNEYNGILRRMADNFLVPRSRRGSRGTWVRERMESFEDSNAEFEDIIKAMEQANAGE